MPRKQSTTPPNVLEDDPTETLSPEEEAAVTAEANATEADKVVLPEEQQQQPPAEAKPEEKLTEREGFPEKTDVERRIQSLVDEVKSERQERMALQERWARLDEKKKVIEEAGRQAQEEAARRERAAQRPDPDIDPTGAKLWDMEQTQRQILEERAQERQAYQQWLQTQQQQTEQQRIQMDVENWRANQEAVAKTAHPDYGDAIEFLHRKRVEHWQLMGNPPAEAENMWMRERFAYMAQTKYNQDRGLPTSNFGEIAYKLAQDVGYRPNGTAALAAPAANGGVNRVEQIKAAQQRQGLGGKLSPASGTDEVQSIAVMDAARFAQYLEEVFRDGEDMVAMQANDPAKWRAIEKRMSELNF